MLRLHGIRDPLGRGFVARLGGEYRDLELGESGRRLAQLLRFFERALRVARRQDQARDPGLGEQLCNLPSQAATGTRDDYHKRGGERVGVRLESLGDFLVESRHEVDSIRGRKGEAHGENVKRLC